MKKYILIIIFMIFLVRDEYDFKMDFYKNVTYAPNPYDILVLVNKKYNLKYNFIPNNLRKIDNKYSYDDKMLVDIAALEFENLSKNAYKNGYTIFVVSAYRSYFYQEKLFNKYVEAKGLKYALACSAKPGHSEHQTGLAIDVAGSNIDYNQFSKSKEFTWMIKNAHKYGYILRYPKDKEEITGYKAEPWHYRYVGKKVAKIIYRNNITLEEYCKHFK